MAFPSSSSPLVSIARAKILRRQSSLAPSRAAEDAALSGCESTSMLMDMSLGQLDYSSPQKGGGLTEAPTTPALRDIMSNDLDLDALSTDDLERLAWEAQEQEKVLRSQLQKCHREEEDGEEHTLDVEFAAQLNDPMRNITVRSPRRSGRRTVSPSKIVKAEVYSLTLEAAQIKTARRSKSVTFGRVDKYEISRQSEMSCELQIPGAEEQSSPLGPVKKPAVHSTAGVDNAATMAPPVLKAATNRVFGKRETETAKKSKGGDLAAKVPKKRRSSCASSPLRDTGIRTSRAPLQRTRQPRTAVEDAEPAQQKRVVAARKSVATIQARRPTTSAAPLPSGYRITSTGTLVNTTAPKAPAMTTRRVKAASTAAVVTGGVPRANPVPEWLKRRKEQLAAEESERLAEQCERVRLLELQKGKKEAGRMLAPPATAAARPSSVLRRSASQGFVSAVDRRLAERAEWEAQRKAREAVLEQERECARLQREEEDEREYRLERQRTVVHANPLPDWLHTTIRQ